MYNDSVIKDICRMTDMLEIERIAKENGGLVTTAQATSIGIPRARLSEMAKAGKLERVQRGVYCINDEMEDEFLAAQLRFPKGVFSDETSLYLHGYTDRVPFQLTMTFPRSYKATSAREAGIRVRTCSDETLDLGAEDIITPYGNEVRGYDLERTLCDILRGQAVADVQVVNPAMKRYFRSPDRDIQKVLGYARALNVEKKVRTYMEVLL